MSASDPARLVPFGDSAVLIVLGEGGGEQLQARVHRLAARLADLHARDARLGRPVPASASVLVPVDPLDPGVEEAIVILSPLVAEVEREPPPSQVAEGQPTIDIPTRYGGPAGPDLADVAALHGLRPDAVVELHASVVYRVQFLGFAPGFAYLGSVPPRIATPRLSAPRLHVPAGSVAIAGQQTAVYPADSPGGWRLIGRTDLRVWDPTTEPPALLSPGRRVRFVPIGW
jgi:KipI family sensor histidine kinase inhibitor